MNKKIISLIIITMLSASHLKSQDFLDTLEYDSALSPTTIYRNGDKKGYLTRALPDGEQLQLFYTLKGTGEKTLVFMHGFPLSSAQWDNQVNELSKEYQVLTLDLRGMGSSSRIAVNSCQDYIDDLHFVLSELGITKFVFIGHSSGGVLGILYATQFPEEVEKLVLVETTPQLLSTDTVQWGIAGALMQQFITLLRSKKEADFETFASQWNELALNDPLDLANLKHSCFQLIASNEPELLANMIEQMSATAVTDLLPRIAVPTLITAGGIDLIAPAGASFAMKALIPNCQLYVFNGSGHMAFATQPYVFTKVLRKFLRNTLKG